MTKLLVLAPVLLTVAACNMMKKTDAAADGGAPSAETTTATTAPTTSIVDKALSFVGGGGPFEGELTMNLSSDAKPAQTIVYMVKGPKMRFNTPSGPGGGGYAIFDSTTKKMTTVVDARKVAMVIDLNAAPGAMTLPGGAASGAKVDRTGKTDTVAGYSCDVLKVTSDNGDKTDLCLAKGIAFPQMPGVQTGWMSAVGSEGFPLRAVIMDSAGKEKSRMEVTKIDKKTLDDAQFTVPAGYSTQDMSAMMKAMGGMGGMGGRPPH